MFKFLIAVFVIGLLLSSCSGENPPELKTKVEDNSIQHDHEKMMQKMNMGEDTRISLNLAPMQAEHQLMNMRSHVQAVQAIIEHLSHDEFSEASTVAHTKLGLTEEMKMMCSSFGNEEFQSLGFEFHEKADQMGELFKTGDKNRSLQALAVTMNYCVSCHARFRQ